MNATCPKCSTTNVVAGLRLSPSQVEGKSSPPTVTCFKCGEKFIPKPEARDAAPE